MDTIKKLKAIQYFVIDVDGTLTDGGIYYDENGNETKKFCTKDAAGFFAAHQVGLKTMVLTGRKCRATERRMDELKVNYLYQDVKYKVSFLREFMDSHNISSEMIAYIGDDLNDIPSMSLCGFVGCPNDSCQEVKLLADYVSDVKGGYGAVRDIIEFVLRKREEWKKAVDDVWGIGF